MLWIQVLLELCVRSICGSGPQVLPVWGLAIPLPAVLMITVGLYMMVLGVGLWIRYCLKVCSSGLVPGEELFVWWFEAV